MSFINIYQFYEQGEGSFLRARGKMKSQNLQNKRRVFSAEKLSTILLKMSSEFIRVYLWFLQFSNYLLRLVQ